MPQVKAMFCWPSTGVTTEYMKKHTETHWVIVKYVALRCVEHWESLKEYFLTFLPQQKNFKNKVEKTQRYFCIKTALSKSVMEAYVLCVDFVEWVTFLTFRSFLFLFNQPNL